MLPETKPFVRWSTSRSISLAILAGVFFGLIDAATLQWNFLGSRGWIDYLPGSVWITCPAVFVVLLVVAIVPAMFVPPNYRGAVTLAFITLCGFGLLILVRVAIPLRLLLPRVHYLIPAIAALVVTLPLVLIAARKANVFSRFRWLNSAAAVLILALMIPAILLVSRNSPVTAAKPATAAKPNVILIFLDTLRFDASGMARGQEHLAPELARFASEATVFENAWAPSPWTLPSHMSVITGFSEPELGITYDQQRYSASRLTLAQILRRSGYSTGAVVANPFLNPGSGFQLGFQSFRYAQHEIGLCRASLATVVQSLAPEWVRLCRPSGAQVAGDAVRFIRSAPRPFFLTLNFMDVHAPYDVPVACRDDGYQRFRPMEQYPILDRTNRFGDAIPSETQRLMKRNYAAAMRCLDARLGKLLADVDGLTDSDSTYVAMVGDHGEQFGEHGLALHSNSVYRQVLHVPLAIRGPQFPAIRREEPVSISWLYGTLLKLTGTPTGQLPTLLDAADRPPVISAYRVPRRVLNIPERLSLDVTSVVSGSLHYLLWENGKHELYDLRSDPDELTDIGKEPDFASVRQPLENLLKSSLATIEAKPEGRRRLFSLGYTR